MAPLALKNFDAVTFDVYGTLIDWEPSITAFLCAWAGRQGVRASGEALLMAYERIRRPIQAERPAHLFPDILRRCFDGICGEFGVIPDAATREAFAASPGTWPAWPDSHAGLVALQKRARIAALSNIDDASLAASSRVLGVTFDLLVTAERVGSYKPGMAHFEAALAALGAMGILPARVLHVAQSLRADIVPANRLGLTCVWVQRPDRVLGRAGDGAEEARPDLTVSSLAELVTVLGAS